MKSPDKTELQKNAIAKQRKESISALLKLSPNFGCQGLVGQFVDKYIPCEIIAKKILIFHNTDTGSGSTDLYITSLKSSLNHFNADYDEIKINNVFKGGSGIKGRKSARQLRNGYLHSLNQNDKAEIEHHYSELVEDMNYFLQLAKGLFDNV